MRIHSTSIGTGGVKRYTGKRNVTTTAHLPEIAVYGPAAFCQPPEVLPCTVVRERLRNFRIRSSMLLPFHAEKNPGKACLSDNVVVYDSQGHHTADNQEY